MKKQNKELLLIIAGIIILCFISYWVSENILFPTDKYKSQLDLDKSDLDTRLEKSEKYVCNTNYYNCADFDTQAQAQIAFENCGGIDNDIHYLDADSDGIACEWLD